MTVDSSGGQLADAGVGAEAGQLTGKFIVLLDPDNPGAGMAALAEEAGVSIPTARSRRRSLAEALAEDDSVVLNEIGVAVVSANPDQQRSLFRTAAQSDAIFAIEPERVVTILPASADFLRGYRAGVDALVEQLLGETEEARVAAAAAADETRFTWGLQATRCPESCHTGNGVKVAVLDTGMDLNHRDYVGRTIVSASFIAGEEVQDGNGHGTHCIGTSCGPRQPTTLPRYGVAFDAAIHAGKVLSNAGSGADGGILAGIDWAIGEGCRVISMSLGAPTSVGDTFSTIYEEVARRALAKGTLIVAAAGNDSRRPGSVRPVSHPANCPSILAVAALNEDLTVASFSNAGLNPDGGQIDIAAPGVNVLSSYPEPEGYRRLRGTSMATPHVAGIVALLAEATPGAGPEELKNALLSSAVRLPAPSTDVGAGLVQAP
jgi:subtilisin family serine protease